MPSPGAASDLARPLGEATADVAAARVELAKRELHQRLRLGEIVRAEGLAEAVKAVVERLDVGQPVERLASRAGVGVAIRCRNEEMPVPDRNEPDGVGFHAQPLGKRPRQDAGEKPEQRALQRLQRLGLAGRSGGEAMVRPRSKSDPAHDGGRRLVADERHGGDMAAEKEEEPFVLGAKRQAETGSEHGDGRVRAEDRTDAGGIVKGSAYGGVADGRRVGCNNTGSPRKPCAGASSSPGPRAIPSRMASWKAASRGRHPPSTRSTTGTSPGSGSLSALSSAKGPHPSPMTTPCSRP